MRPTIRARCLALPLVALTLAACGSSDDGSKDPPNRGSGTASDQLSKAELIARADKICADTAERIRARSTPTSLADIEQFSEENANATDEGVGKLEALTPPDSVKADYEAFIERAEVVAEQARDVAEATKTNDISKVIAATENVASDAESQRLARKIGFKGMPQRAGFTPSPGHGCTRHPESAPEPLNGRLPSDSQPNGSSMTTARTHSHRPDRPRPKSHVPSPAQRSPAG